MLDGDYACLLFLCTSQKPPSLVFGLDPAKTSSTATRGAMLGLMTWRLPVLLSGVALVGHHKNDDLIRFL